MFLFLTRIIDKVWKKQRKYINPSFSSKYLDRFVQTFSENFYNFSQEIGRWSSEKNCDLFPELFRCNIETAFSKYTIIP